MADFATIINPLNTTLNLNCASVNTASGIVSGNLILPTSFNNVVANANPQPANIVVTGYPGMKVQLGLNESSYFSIYKGSVSVPTGVVIINPVPSLQSSLNITQYNAGTGVLTIGITGYYKLDFYATLNVQPTTVFSGSCQYGIASTLGGFEILTTTTSIPSLPTVQVIPVSNSAIIKLVAGTQLNLESSSTFTGSNIAITDISWNLVLIDSVSP